MELGLAGKIALVTGAAGGVGCAIARALCREKVTTCFTDLDAEGLASALRGHEELGRALPCDIASRTEVRRLFERIEGAFGGLHILVNCAAVNSAEYIEQIGDEELERVLNVNVKGYVYTTIEAVSLMKRAGYGRLIYINSGSGLKASAGLPLYSGSKYFNRGFAISAALELGRHNITANSICPSDIYPEQDADVPAGSWRNESLIRVSLEKEGVATLEELIEKRRRSNPMGRSCTTADVANLAVFLASERAGFVNGQSIGLNGGALPC